MRRARLGATLGLWGALVMLPVGAPVGAEEASAPPAWLAPYVGEGAGQIAAPVLARARALYLRKVAEGAARNPCYFAMDATRPNTEEDGAPGRRFYMICEAARTFQAMPAGHGAGRRLEGLADFANGRECARHFGNAQDSELTAGGAYVTAETKASFKGYYLAAPGQDVPLLRAFVQFEGEGETANARQRAIGGHAAVTLKGLCRRPDRRSPYADADGYVIQGTLVDYTGGRSNGCTSWSPADAAVIGATVKDAPTTLYIYPEAADIAAVAHAVAAGRPPSDAGTYWNAACLRTIGSPVYWPQAALAPLIAQYRRDHPPPPPRPLPLCAAR
ncbi:hypothetical protein [Nitrospirillum sp. BR 11828]|uniref:hypothetical protein n=1 Tax=Nitrospirillum sp. BR 11828 TaxID=3104325 RepID=UPI002AC9FE9E|nr:hypothetical protein [Nitrospirillum sp. BR 11828]MDZ5650381.1 hypothetical protein [Nitrospirillum sp. BR 11828]